MTKWPTAKHFTSWLSLAPANKISGGRVLGSTTRRSSNRATALLRTAAVAVGKTQTALGAFYRRLAARIGRAKAVTATARKLAILFYRALRFGLTYADPGVSAYQGRYRQRVIHNLHRRAKSLGFTLVANGASTSGVSRKPYTPTNSGGPTSPLSAAIGGRGCRCAMCGSGCSWTNAA